MFLECYFNLVDPLKRNLNTNEIMNERNIIGWVGGETWNGLDVDKRGMGKEYLHSFTYNVVVI